MTMELMHRGLKALEQIAHELAGDTDEVWVMLWLKNVLALPIASIYIAHVDQQNI